MCDATTWECTCKYFSPYAGAKCDQPCGTNCDRGCTQNLFICNGCRDKTKTGSKCDEPCPISCRSTCQQNRRCHYCKDFYYGDTCEKSCSSGCENGCDRSSGECNGGCKTGFWGVKCDQICTTTCVVNSVLGVCKQSDGSCDSCVQGYWGRECLNNCNTNCHVNGRTGTACYQPTGYCDYCTDACQFNCSNQCVTDTCNKEDGGCTCKPGYKPNTCVTGR